MRHGFINIAVFTVLSFGMFGGAWPMTAKGTPTVVEDDPRVEYKLLATSKTSTMQKEMNDAAAQGFRFSGLIGGETSFGGSETVIIMTRSAKSNPADTFQYRLLATIKTSTMQKEMSEAGSQGFDYKGLTVFNNFGGQEVVIILERDPSAKVAAWEYKLLGTKKTSTMQKELSEAGAQGFEFLGLTVKEGVFANEVVCILRRPALAR